MNKLKILHLVAIICSAVASAITGFVSGADPMTTAMIGGVSNTVIAAIGGSNV